MANAVEDKTETPKDEPVSSSPDELKSAEESGGETGSDFSYREEEQSGIGKLRSASSSRFKKRGLILAGALGGGVLIVLVGVMFFLSSLKAVHFSKVLRSVGFARFNLYMNRTFADTVFNAAVLTEDSTGKFHLEDRSLLDRLRGVNPEKQLAVLGDEGTVKFNFEGESKWGGTKITNNFKGVEINGENISLDQVAQKYGYESYDSIKLTDIKAKLGIQSEFVSAIKDGLSERLALEGRMFRSSVYDGMRQATGIRMWEWLNAAKEYFGKSALEARTQNLKDAEAAIDKGSTIPKSSLDPVQEAADEEAAAEKEAIKTGTQRKPISPKLTEINNVASDVSTAVFVATMACIVHDLSNSFKDAAKPREQQVARFGHNQLSTADQITSGATTSAAVGAANDKWNGAENAAFYKQDTGQSVSNSQQKQLATVPSVTPPASAFGGAISTVNDVLEYSLGGPFVDTLQKVPVIGGLIGGAKKKLIDVGCNAVLNQFVQYGIAGAEIGLAVFTAGAEYGAAQAMVEGLKASVQFAGTVGLGELVGSAIEDAIGSYSGADFSATTQSTDLYNQQRVATDYLQQTGDRQVSYGRPLDAQETSASQSVAMADLHDQYNNQGLKERYFAIDNPFSLVGSLAAMVPGNFSEMFTSIQNVGLTLLSSAQNIIQNAASIFIPHQKVLAATNAGDFSAYGVNEWGWSNDELNRIETDPAFTPQNLADYVEARYKDLEDKYEPCYTYELQVDKPDKCTKDFLQSDEALKWRAYKAESYAADALSQDLGSTSQ